MRSPSLKEGTGGSFGFQALIGNRNTITNKSYGKILITSASTYNNHTGSATATQEVKKKIVPVASNANGQ